MFDDLTKLTTEQLLARRKSAYYLICWLCVQTDLLRDDDMIRSLYDNMKKLQKDIDNEIVRRRENGSSN